MRKTIIFLFLCFWGNWAFPSAFDYLEEITEFGPRVPNSYASEQTRQYIIEKLSPLPNIEIRIDTFFTFLRGKAQIGINIIARSNPEIEDRMLLCTHYDTRFSADDDAETVHLPVPGANDGASGVAALLTIAEGNANYHTKLGLDFAFFDLEDQGEDGSSEYWALGAKNFCNKISPTTYKLVILLDMIAGKNQEFPQENFTKSSFPELNNAFWEMGKLSRKKGSWIYDDHMPFVAMGVPTIAVIGWPYPQHHTIYDTPKYCRPNTLNKIINTTYRFLRYYSENQYKLK